MLERHSPQINGEPMGLSTASIQFSIMQKNGRGKNADFLALVSFFISNAMIFHPRGAKVGLTESEWFRRGAKAGLTESEWFRRGAKVGLTESEWFRRGAKVGLTKSE